MRTISLKIRARKLKVIAIALLSVATMHSAAVNANQELESIVAHVNGIRAGASDFAIPKIHQYSDSGSTIDIENSTQPFIIGGTNAARGEYEEYTLVILTDGRGNVTGLCGGTLISSNTVLTAAHCSQSSASTYFTIPGFYAFSDPVTSGDLIQASTLRVHPDYASDTFDNDVAIITLSRASFLPAAKVFEGDSDLNGTLGTVIGTGLSATIPRETALNILQEVAAPIRSNTACNSDWEQLIGIQPITQNMLCAGFTTNGRGSCSGDSGGPLYADFKGTRAVVGTVSFGLGACETNRGTQGYARMSALSDFIKSASPNTEFVRSNDTAFLPSIMMLLNEESTPLPLPLATNLTLPITPFSQGKYVVRFNSQPGDAAGLGNSYKYTPTNSNIEIKTGIDNALTIELTGFGASRSLSNEQRWTWKIQSHSTERLKKGIYNNAKHYFNFDGFSNVLLVEQSSIACDTATGGFRVLDISYSGNTVTKLVADFFQHCNFDTPKLTGSIYYDVSKNGIEPFYPATEGKVLTPPLSNPTFAGAVVKIESDQNDPFGRGGSYFFSPQNSNVAVNAEFDQSINVLVSDADTWWTFTFKRPNLDADPNNGNRLSTGIYSNTRPDLGDSLAPSLNVSSSLTGSSFASCAFNQIGEFRVFDISYIGSSNVPDRFIADLVIRCNGGTSPALRVSINYNKT